MFVRNVADTEWVAFNKCSNATCPDHLADWSTVYLPPRNTQSIKLPLFLVPFLTCTLTWSRYGVELYNHSDHPVPVSYDMETLNIAKDPSAVAVVAELHKQLKAFNTR